MSCFRRVSALLLSAWVLLVAGCATPRPASQRALPFEFMGRVLVHSSGNAFSANTRWVHTQDFDELWLLTPTGQAIAQMREDGEGATLTGMDQVTYRGARVETLTRRALGWEFPLSRLQHWVRGVPAPGSQAEIKEREAAGKVRVMVQDGWTISYEYYPPKAHDGLPRRMEVSGAAQSLRLVIDTWGRAKTEGQ